VANAVDGYVRACIAATGESLARAVAASGDKFGANDIAYLLTTLMPDLLSLSTFVYQNVQGIGFTTGMDITSALEHAHRNATEQHAAELILLASNDAQGEEKEQRSLEPYLVHPAIEACAGALFRDGHYKQAASESYICVIEAVKAKSGLRLDGDDLMN